MHTNRNPDPLAQVRAAVPDLLGAFRVGANIEQAMGEVMQVAHGALDITRSCIVSYQALQGRCAYCSIRSRACSCHGDDVKIGFSRTMLERMGGRSHIAGEEMLRAMSEEEHALFRFQMPICVLIASGDVIYGTLICDRENGLQWEPREMETVRLISDLCAMILSNSVAYDKRFFEGKTLEMVLNNLDAHVLVTRLNTGERLFVNEKAKRDIQHAHGGEIEELLATCDPRMFRCDTASASREIEIENTGRTYRKQSSLVEWMDGSSAHLSYAVDITDLKSAEREITYQLERQQLVSEVLFSFISTKSLGEMIDEALERIGTFMGASRVMICRVDRDKHCFYNQYEWCDAHTQPTPPIYADSPYVLKPEFQATLEQNRSVVVDDLRAESDAIIVTPRNDDIRSLASAPLMLLGELYGFLGLDICDAPHHWTLDEISLIETIAGLLTAPFERAVMEDDLREAKMTAERASGVRGEFLSRMSHEIRTPMNAIIGMTSIALGSNDMAKMRKCLEKVDAASQHLLGIINDILDMNQIESNRLALEVSTFPFERMLRTAVASSLARIAEKRQTFDIRVADDIPPELMGDERRLAQVITNLLSNAVKFTPDGGRIALTARVAERKGDELMLSLRIRDNGIGITPEHKRRLFTSFEQLEVGNARRYGGTGLGLAIVKRIVELMGGETDVTSEKGMGSTFSVTVRLRAAAMPATVSQQLEGCRVVYVDEPGENRDFISAMLAARGAQVLALPDERQSIDAPVGLPDIALINWNMQPGAAPGILSALRKRHGAELPVVALANGPMEEVTRELAGDRAARPLIRPILGDQLANALRSALDANAGCEPAPTETPAPQEIQEVRPMENTPFDAASLMPYMDVADGLSRVRNNTKLFMTLLNTFVKNTRMQDLTQQIAGGDFKTAAMTAHTIKGVAANLSLKDVYEHVVLVEMQLKSGFAGQPQMEALAKSVEATLDAIARYTEELRSAGS